MLNRFTLYVLLFVLFIFALFVAFTGGMGAAGKEGTKFVMGKIIENVKRDCETQSDWLTHLADPQLRQAAAEFAVAFAQSIGC